MSTRKQMYVGSLNRLALLLCLVGSTISGSASAADFVVEVPAAISAAQFDKQFLTASTQRPVIVAFHADWCGYCRRQAPALEALAREYAGRIDVIRVDVDRNEAMAQRFGIKGLPTLVALEFGVVSMRVRGGIGLPELRKLFANYSAQD